MDVSSLSTALDYVLATLGPASAHAAPGGDAFTECSKLADKVTGNPTPANINEWQESGCCSSFPSLKNNYCPTPTTVAPTTTTTSTTNPNVTSTTICETTTSTVPPTTTSTLPSLSLAVADARLLATFNPKREKGISKVVYKGPEVEQFRDILVAAHKADPNATHKARFCDPSTQEGEASRAVEYAMTVVKVNKKETNLRLTDGKGGHSIAIRGDKLIFKGSNKLALEDGQISFDIRTPAGEHLCTVAIDDVSGKKVIKFESKDTVKPENCSNQVICQDPELPSPAPNPAPNPNPGCEPGSPSGAFL